MQDEVRDKSVALVIRVGKNGGKLRSEEHTSELQSQR